VLLAIVLAVVDAWGGLALAFYTDWPTSFWITALSGLIYFMTLIAPHRPRIGTKPIGRPRN
jgi:zinc/manganese transport system permease protein